MIVIQNNFKWRFKMITCNVCGCLNDPANLVCVECGSDLSDSQDFYMPEEDFGDM